MIRRFQGLQIRLLASLVLSVGAALATVAIMARWSTTAQFEQYVQQNQAEMQQVAKTLAVPNLFERFYRVDRSRARATGGAGIGLAVVKQLVDAHGGVVGVRSVVGSGTTFSFTLPRAQPLDGQQLVDR